jgi:hypothetical protein
LSIIASSPMMERWMAVSLRPGAALELQLELSSQRHLTNRL